MTAAVITARVKESNSGGGEDEACAHPLPAETAPIAANAAIRAAMRFLLCLLFVLILLFVFIFCVVFDVVPIFCIVLGIIV
jgi:hypothetical protein